MRDSLGEYIFELNKDVGLAGTLEEFGVPEKDFEEHLDTMTQNVLNDPCTGTNPWEMSFKQMKKLFKASYYGKEALVKG